MKEFRISCSQLKKFNASKAERAGKYIMWIKEQFQNDAFPLWLLFENWLMTGKDEYDKFLDGQEIVDKAKLLQDYDTLKHNSKGLKFEVWEPQYEIKGELFWVPILWYVDNLTDEWIDDIKTTRYLNKKDSKQINSRSGMTYYEEYETQLWIYMKLMWRKKGRILEIAKHKYKDKRHANQIIEFHWSKAWDKKMTEKRQPIVEEMWKMRDEYSPLFK